MSTIDRLTGITTITVHGTPIPQGSKTKTNWGGMRDANDKTLRPWRKKLREHAEDAMRYTDTLTGPVAVRITFTFDRPQSHYRTGRNAHLLKDAAPLFPSAKGGGDVDKLQRACFDSLTDAKVWTDDALVVDVRARKVYAGEHDLALDRAGVRIEVQPLLDQAVL